MDGFIIVQFGGTGSGKTTKTKSVLQKLKGKKPFFIYDIDGEYKEFYNKPYIPLADFYQKTLKIQNSVIVFEEAFLFFDHAGSSSDIKELIVCARRRGNIIIFNFHAFRQVPIYLLQYANFLFIKKTVLDSTKRFEKDYPGICTEFWNVQKSSNFFECKEYNLRPKVS